MKTNSPFFIFILMIAVFSTTACKPNSQGSSPFIPIDTLVLDYKITMSTSKYVPEYNTQVNQYFTKIDNKLCFVYSIDSIKPTSIFKLQGPLSAYFSLNKDLLIVNYPYSEKQLLINNQSEIIDTLNLDFGKLFGENRRLWTFRHNYTIKKENGEFLLFIQTTSPSLDNFQINTESRKKLFSEPILTCYKFSNNKINLEQGVGQFPISFISKEGMYNYNFKVSLNKNQEYLFSFFELDSLYICDLDGNFSSKPIKSKYKDENISYPKDLNVYDYAIQEEASSKTVGYLNHYYDSYRNQYYIIVKKEYTYENDDGTINKPKDAPWSIIIFNSKLEKVDEIDIPDNYSKFEFFIVPEGIAILDKHLTEKQPNKSVLVIFKIQDYD